MERTDRRDIGVAGIYMLTRLVLWVLSPILYLWTLYLAYLTSFGAVLISLIIPIGPQLYYAWVIWNGTGTLANLYIILCGAWLVAALLGFIIRMWIENKA